MSSPLPVREPRGDGKGAFAIIGPGWTGTLPDGVKEIKSPTNMAWIIIRTQTNGKADYAAVHAIQDQYKLTPLGAWGKPYLPPANSPVPYGIDVKTPPVEQVAKMDSATFFNRLNMLMKDNPPADADAPAVARFAAIGVGPGKSFDPKGLETAATRGQETIVAGAKQYCKDQRQWLGDNAGQHRELWNGL